MKTKQVNFWVIWICLACLVSGAIFFVGDMLECEFPYFVTLASVRHAKTPSGDDATSIIAQRLSINPNDVDYHRCSYCKNVEGNYPAGSIRIQVLHESSNVYGFAYHPNTDILQPADSETAIKFPKMGTSVVSQSMGEPNKHMQNISARRETF